jgi:prophage regulatory protein
MKSKITTAPPVEAPIRVISKPEVIDRVGVSYPTIWQWMRDGKFPRSRKMGGHTCWLESEIDTWIMNLPLRRLKGDEKAA